MKQYNITPEQAEFIEKAYSLINSARYPSFAKVTDTYNEVFGTRLKHTSCGSCIRSRILDLHKALEKHNLSILHNLQEDEKKSDLSLNENGSNSDGRVDTTANDSVNASQPQDLAKGDIK